MSNLLRTAWGTLAVALAVLSLKFAAYAATSSVALYSDALESTINVVGALGALVALWVSTQPADANHPYGHQKAEYLSAVVEGGLVLATAFVIARARRGRAGSTRTRRTLRCWASCLMVRAGPSTWLGPCSCCGWDDGGGRPRSSRADGTS